MERSSAASGEDWIIVGDLFHVVAAAPLWFFAGRGARDPLSPFPVSEDFIRPLRYCDAMIHVRSLWEKVVGPEAASRYGLHSLRVITGYDCVRATDLQLAVAQGGWRSDAHERHARCSCGRAANPRSHQCSCRGDRAACSQGGGDRAAGAVNGSSYYSG
eukprot:1824312-Pleurochrysis_carterae.AAC.3